MNVKLKKLHKDAVIPCYAHMNDAGADMTCVSAKHGHGFIEYDTGIALEIPNGYVGLLFPRSSVSKTGQWLCNSIGVVDANYRGSVKFRYYWKHTSNGKYKIGDRVGQIIIIPIDQIQFEEVDELSNTDRSSGSFGSTGN